MGLGLGTDPTRPPASPTTRPQQYCSAHRSFEITPASAGPPALPPATIPTLPHSALPHSRAFAPAGPPALALLSLTLSYLRPWLRATFLGSAE